MPIDKKHIPKILVHISLWFVLYWLLIYPSIEPTNTTSIVLPVKLIITTLLFYVNYFYLVPKLLLANHKFSYIIISLLLLTIVGFGIHFVVQPPLRPDGFQGPIHPMQTQNDVLFSFRILLMPILNFGLPYSFSTMLRLYAGWENNEDLRKSIEKEKIESELQFLKTQLNPHFLFNSLNTIYALSVKQSADTSDAIINLSEMMRYMLYEADNKLVPLCKEVEYIKSYVALQILRLSSSENVTLKISGDESGKYIPPLLFISFIENAFKYGTDYNGNTVVKINFSFYENTVKFQVINTIGNFKAESNSSGLGLENVKSRLHYLYPKSHELLINDDGETYKVDLTLNI